MEVLVGTLGALEERGEESLAVRRKSGLMSNPLGIASWERP